MAQGKKPHEKNGKRRFFLRKDLKARLRCGGRDHHTEKRSPETKTETLQKRAKERESTHIVFIVVRQKTVPTSILYIISLFWVTNTTIFLFEEEDSYFFFPYEEIEKSGEKSEVRSF